MGAFLAIALIAWVFTKTISDARTDHTYAKQGLTSPRLQAKYGSSAREKTARYGFVDYAKDAWSDHWQRRSAALAADREAYLVNPGPRVRFRDRLAKAKEVMHAAYRKVVDPVPANADRPAMDADETRGAPKPVLAVDTGDVPVGTIRLTDSGRQQWDGTAWKPVADPTDPSTVCDCDLCKGAGVVDGKPCQPCLDRQERRNADWDGASAPDAEKSTGQTSAPKKDTLAAIDRLIDAELRRRAALSPADAAAEEAWRTRANAAQLAAENERAKRIQADWNRQDGLADPHALFAPARDAWNRRDWAGTVAALDEIEASHPREYARSEVVFDEDGRSYERPCRAWHAESRRRMAKAAGEPDDQQTDEPSEASAATTGGTMSAPTGEAVNYETTVAELEKLAAEQRAHLDHCTAALAAIEQAKAAINNMQESYRASAAAAAATAEHLTAKHLDGVTLAHAGTTVDAMPAGAVDQMYDELEGMEAQAKARLADAEVALGATEANLSHVQATYGDAHATVAGNLSGDSSFLDSGGGGGTGSPSTPTVQTTHGAQSAASAAAVADSQVKQPVNT